MQHKDNVPPHIDVCILCALAEEADGLKEAFKSQLALDFQRKYNARLKRGYDYTNISNKSGEQLGVLVTWLPDTGPLETGLELKSLCDEFKPRFVAMTGICAGDKKKVKLGDIIVAERAFLYDTGKVVVGEDGRPELLRDTRTLSPTTEVIHFARGFTGWKEVVAHENRPPSKRQQRDWLLNKLLDSQTPRIDNIPVQEREANAPAWRQIVQALQSDSDRYLTENRRLESYDKVNDLYYGVEPFPFKDPATPSVYVTAIASGNAVRSDSPFKEISVPVRGTWAIDMEGAAFYRTLSEFSDVHYLLVKGVSDYADSDKDDSYHAYAARVSALYILTFIKEYVTSSRLPGSARQQIQAGVSINGNSGKQISSTSSTSTSGAQNMQQAYPQNEFNIFYSYAPGDEPLREELAKHLTLLKRQKLIDQVYAHNIEPGQSKDEGDRLQRSRLILLLISPDFMSSDDLYDNELEPALELQKQGKARIIPILLRPIDLKGTSLDKLVVLPRNHKPIVAWSNRDEAFAGVAKEIRAVVEQLRSKV